MTSLGPRANTDKLLRPAHSDVCRRVSPEHVAGRLMARLLREKVLEIQPGEKAFYLIRISDERLLVIFESLSVTNPARLMHEDLRKRVSVDLGGVPVLGFSGPAFYYQIGTWPQRIAGKDIPSVALSEALSSQPSPLHVPMGTTIKGREWRHIERLDSVLIVGPRGSGKTTLMHTWIQALARGGEVVLFLWDNKAGNEFLRYSNIPNVHVAVNQQLEDHDRLAEGLGRIGSLLDERTRIYARYGGSPTLADHNAKAEPEDRLKPIVICVDEIFFMPQEVRQALTKLVTLGRAYGLYAVLGCQQADRSVLDRQLDANMTTRIAFRVTDANESRIALGRRGAEQLARVPGRYLFFDGVEFLTVQGYSVDLPVSPRLDAVYVPAVCVLSGEEAALVKVSLQRFDGYFRIVEIAREIGRNPKYTGRFAVKWAEAGWLTPVQSTKDNPPRRIGRRLTRTLVRMAGMESVDPALYASLPEVSSMTIAGKTDEFAVS